MHPAVVRVESLIDKELSPGDGSVNVQSLLADHLQFGAEVVRGMRIDPEQGMTRCAAARRYGEAVGAAGSRLGGVPPPAAGGCRPAPVMRSALP